MRLIIVFVCFFIYQGYKAQWTLTPCPTTNNLKSMHFGNQNVGYAVGNNGVILKTTDQGNSWGILNSGTSADLSSIHCSASDTLFISKKLAINDYANILYSFNGGTTWSVSLFYLPSGTVSCIYSKPPSTLAAVGGVNVTYPNSFPHPYLANYGTGCSSKNNGSNWLTQLPGGWYTRINSVFFVDTLVGYSCGTSQVFKTIDGGINWTQPSAAASTSQSGNSIYFTNYNVGYIAADNGVIRKTIDGGINWTTLQGAGGANNLRAIHFTGLDTGCVVGDNGMILGTIDGGNTWHVQSSGTTNNLNSVYFTSSSTGYIVGDNGTILKTTHSPVGIEEIDGEQNEIFIYPNPATNYLIIDHKKIEGSIVLYDLMGKEIFIENFVGMSNKIDLQNLNIGIYFIKIKSGSNLYSKKIVRE